MAAYTFYVLELDGYLVGGTVVDCLDDAAAIARADELLGTFNAGVEVWHQSRKVGCVGVSSGFSDAKHSHQHV
jgi:hypothetical protein